MNNLISTHSMGGGITIAEASLDENLYAVVSTEAPEFMSFYRRVDGEETYLPEDMSYSIAEELMSEEVKEVYHQMLEALKKA